MKSSRFREDSFKKEKCVCIFSPLFLQQSMNAMARVTAAVWTLRQHIKDRETPVKRSLVPDGRGKRYRLLQQAQLPAVSFMLKRETNFCLILSHCYLGRFYYMHLNLSVSYMPFINFVFQYFTPSLFHCSVLDDRIKFQANPYFTKNTTIKNI